MDKIRVLLECAFCKLQFTRMAWPQKKARGIHSFCCSEHRYKFHTNQKDKKAQSRPRPYGNKLKDFDDIFLAVGNKRMKAKLVRETFGLDKETVQNRIEEGWPIYKAYTIQINYEEKENGTQNIAN